MKRSRSNRGVAVGGRVSALIIGLAVTLGAVASCGGSTADATTTTRARAGTTRRPSTTKRRVASTAAPTTAVKPAAKSTTTLVKASPMTRAGAAGNEYRIVAPVLGKGRRLTASGLADLQGKVNGLLPGDVLDVGPGEYAGSIVIPETVKGTATNGIVIRSTTDGAAIFTRCGRQSELGGTPCIKVDSQYVTIMGFRFTGTKDAAVELQGSRNRIYANTFTDTGTGDNAGCCALIVSPHDWRNKSWNDPNPTMLLRYNRVDRNTFSNIRNAAYAQGHGVVGTVFANNTIIGPPGIEGDWETEAIKIGGDFAKEATDTTIEFNTIKNWRGAPYTIGIKSSNVTVAYNLIELGDINLRIANDTRVIGNVLLDGTIVAGGSGHLIADNYVRTPSAPAGFGPLIGMTNVSVSNSAGNFNGVDKPFYFARFEHSEVVGNTFIVSGQSHAVYFVIVASEPNPSDLTFTGNTFVRSSPGSFVGGIDNLATANDIRSNTFVCLAACNERTLSVSAGGNKLLFATGVDLKDDSPLVPFRADVVNGLKSP